MELKRAAREYYTLGIVTDPAVTSWEATFDGGTTWDAGTAGTLVVDAVTVNVHRWLLAGPLADPGAAVAILATNAAPQVRATDNPEILIRDAPRVYLTA